jgi:arginyl-tRNA synthetase
LRAKLALLLAESLPHLSNEYGSLEAGDLKPQLERTRDSKHGDFTSNIALRLAKKLSRPPRDLAAEVIAALPESELVEKIEIAGPGFINFTLAATAYEQELRAILADGSNYGRTGTGTDKRVLLEYVSANPTGPLHVGHGRHAAYGASLANLLRATGNDVHEEYYVNDAGRQMDILAASVWLRYAELRAASFSFPANAYQGDYVRTIAKSLLESHGESLTTRIDSIAAIIDDKDTDPEQRLDRMIAEIKAKIGFDNFTVILNAALSSVLADIKDDLNAFGVVPQRWYSERSLVDGAIERALQVLDGRKMLYKRDGAKWFKATDFGDEKDRVVVRENGATTYFASDIAYHLDKCERGFDVLLDVLGADHHGYVARVRAGLEAMGQPADCLEVRLVQFVALYRGQKKVQMSTRTGEYVTLRQLRNEVGNDAARFFYVSQSNSQHLDFDMELAKSRSNDNPAYYIQYAHARVASLIERLRSEGSVIDDPAAANLTLLTEDAEKALITSLSRYPETLQLAAVNRAPQHLAHYLRDTAAAFHASYNSHRVLIDDHSLRDARVALALATQQVLRNGLDLLGVSAPENM